MTPDAEVTAAGGVFGAVELARRCAELEAQRDRARDIAVALEGQVAAVRALADRWRYKGEFGWGPWQEGHGPDPEGQVLDECASAIRAALDPDPADRGTGRDGGGA